MSDQKTVPKGLRENEVERSYFKKLLIPYIPVDDKIGETVKSKAQTLKVKIDDKTAVDASVWTGGNPEGVLIHIISAMGYIERSRLYEKWVSAKTNDVDKYAADLQDTQDAVTTLLARSKKLKKAQEESDEPATALPAQAKKGKTNTPTVPDEPSEKEKITDELAQLRKRYNSHLED